MADQRSILFRLLGDSKSLEKATKRGRSSLGDLQSTAKKAAGVLGLAFGADQILRGVGHAISKSNDYAESLNAVKVAAGDAADEIVALGDNGVDKLGLSKLAVNELAVGFSGFVDQMKSGGMNVDGVYEDLITRAVDFGSVMNIEGTEAAQKFASALAGSSEVLMRYGIDISAAAVEQYALANGIVEAGSKMTNQQKVMARYGLLMERTSQYQGDFANTSDGLAGSQKKLAAELENLAITLGDELVPAVTELVTAGSKLVKVIGPMRSAASLAVNPFAKLQGAMREAGGAMDTVADAAGWLGNGLKNITGITLTQWAARQIMDVGEVGSSMADTRREIEMMFNDYARGAELARRASRETWPMLAPDEAELAAFKAKSDRLVAALGNIQKAYEDAATAASAPLTKSGSLAVDDRLLPGGQQDFQDARTSYERINGPTTPSGGSPG